MTARKNPDWSVWLGDVLYWIRTPPGIYIFIILILGASLLGSLHKNNPPINLSAPVYTAPALPQQAVPSSLPPVAQNDGCAPGTLLVWHLDTCIAGHRRTVNIVVPGTKNNCPDDAIFRDRIGRCIPLYSVGNYTIFAGDEFTISGRRDAYVYIRSGQIQIYSAEANFNKILSAGNRPVVIHVGAMIKGIADSSSIRIELDAAPY